MPIYSRLQAPALSILSSVFYHFSSLKYIIVVYEMKVCYNNNESSALCARVCCGSFPVALVGVQGASFLLFCSCKLVHYAVNLLLHFINYTLVQLSLALAYCVKVAALIVKDFCKVVELLYFLSHCAFTSKK